MLFILTHSLLSPREPSRQALWGLTLLAFVLSLLVFAFLYGSSPVIYDADSYYHLAVAREYAQEGMSGPLKSIRGGLLATRFGDKEVLFHLFLEPFVSRLEPSLGGRLALALLGSSILTIVAHFSLRVVGNWGFLIPFWLLVGSSEFSWRLVRLRPELLALILILLALWVAGVRRYRWLIVISAIFALSYTAIHAFVGIFVILFLVNAWARRRWEWRLALFPVVGALIGLLIHPQFPDNLAVWWFQSIEYFRFKGLLDVGTEIRPNFTDVVVMVNLGWFLGLAILWRSTEVGEERDSGDDLWLTFGVGAGVFGGLYLLMSRFSLYFVPLATLWVLFEIYRRGRRWTPWVRLPWRGRVRSSLAWCVCILISLPVARAELHRYRERTNAGPDQVRIVDREAFGQAVPEGGHVLAPWRTTPIYMYYAPQGQYLNVLDPVFLAAADPEADRIQRAVFAGVEPDVPAAAVDGLDSELIAYPVSTGNPTLTQRLLGDPRVEVLHRGSHWLFQIDRSGSEALVGPWSIVPSGSSLPPGNSGDILGWDTYPRAVDANGKTIEGYVDAARVSTTSECIAFAHRLEVASETRVTYELAGSGPTVLWLDGEPVTQMRRGDGAVLGQGTELSLRLVAGEHLLTVLSCVDPESGRNGFYLVERENNAGS